MYELVSIEHILRIPPEKFGQPKELSAYELLREEYEGIIDKNLGFVIAVVDVIEVGLGKIIHGDSRTHHNVKFTLLTFRPLLHEIIEGEVVEVVEFGAFIRLGPQDGLNHVSQITNDFIRHDEVQSQFVGKETGRILGEGDLVRARIIAVSMGGGARSGKLGLTMRQPYLGKLDWIEADIKTQQVTPGEGMGNEGETPQKEKKDTGTEVAKDTSVTSGLKPKKQETKKAAKKNKKTSESDE
ncbi:MAG: DNA-directed RNA polymerase [Promethearchaeota archaeon CR_4]|nr:MAG: DNA-directed RNA polymerase [Candidatus Lokiarchaeota archaeon CR_4]